MIVRMSTIALLFLVCLSALPVAVAAPVPEADAAKIRKALEAGAQGLKVESVTTSEIPGLYAVQFQRGPLVYATGNGEFFIVGDLFTNGPAGFVNLTEKRRDDQRKTQLAGLEQGDMIVFAPDGETRATVTVFTDVTCFYCQKLHREVPELNKRGVAVRYLAYPRAGLGSDGYKQLASAWCASYAYYVSLASVGVQGDQSINGLVTIVLDSGNETRQGSSITCQEAFDDLFVCRH